MSPRLERVGMYAVVGCGECSFLWIVEGRPATSQCPRCGKRRSHDKRRQFVRTEDENHARELRSSMLASRSGHGEAFAELDSFAELDERLDEAGIDDRSYLDGSGLDADTIEQAGERERRSRSRKEVIEDAIRELAEPTAADVRAYASDHGVPSEYTERTLEKLLAAGEATEHDGVYRLL